MYKREEEGGSPYLAVVLEFGATSLERLAVALKLLLTRPPLLLH